MKKLSYVLGLGIALTFASCGSQPENKVEAGEAGSEATAAATSETYMINSDSTQLMWKGSKAAGDHVGTIAVTEGELSVENNAITAGKFVIDMNSIDETEPMSEEMETKLVGHLKSPDFFNVDSFPTADFVVTGFANNTLTGNLTILGTSKEISFPVNYTVEGNTLTADANFTIDRTQWGIQYGSGDFFDLAADRIISNNIEFTVKLVAQK